MVGSNQHASAHNWHTWGGAQQQGNARRADHNTLPLELTCRVFLLSCKWHGSAWVGFECKQGQAEISGLSENTAKCMLLPPPTANEYTCVLFPTFPANIHLAVGECHIYLAVGLGATHITFQKGCTCADAAAPKMSAHACPLALGINCWPRNWPHGYGKS